MDASPITEELRSWDEIHNFFKPGWIYRGQKCEKWSLQTSLERCCDKEEIKRKDRFELETELRREFRRAYHHYAQHIPAPNSIVEWTSLMQHHGAPTRLLDFTYSIYIAAYFALENANSDSAVWAVYTPWVLERSVSKLARIGKSSVRRLQTPTRESHETVAENALFKKPFSKVAVHLTPFFLSERLRTQRGTFLVPGDVSMSFQDNIYALAGYKRRENLIKIVMPHKLRKEAIERLYAMNISRRSLFPGLDGYAQSLGVYHPAFRPDPHLRKYS